MPPKWALGLAFLLIYLAWGTTYLAIRKGVEAFPPILFGGIRITVAGVLLLLYLKLRGHSLRIGRTDFLWTAIVGILLFVGGNGLISMGEKYVDSGVASVMVATTPLWIALLETLWPWGDRLTLPGWVGMLAGLGGVLLLMIPRLQGPAGLFQDAGPLLILASSLTWAMGGVIARHRRFQMLHLVAAAYQMLIGGICMLVLGYAIGEATAITRESFTPAAVYSFFHLLIFGSLIGFVAYNWLLGHVSAAKVGTYAYVNPVVAILVGWLLNGEALTGYVVGGMFVILAGVGLVRSAGIRPGLDHAGRRLEEADQADQVSEPDPLTANTNS